MDKRDLTDDSTNSSDRKQPLKTTVSMPILGQQRTSANNDENRREGRLQVVGKTGEMSSLPDSGDDDDLPRPALTKSTSCYHVQQTQPSADCEQPRANDQ